MPALNSGEETTATYSWAGRTLPLGLGEHTLATHAFACFGRGKNNMAKIVAVVINQISGTGTDKWGSVRIPSKSLDHRDDHSNRDGNRPSDPPLTA